MKRAYLKYLHFCLPEAAAAGGEAHKVICIL